MATEINSRGSTLLRKTDSVNFEGKTFLPEDICMKNLQNDRILHDICPKNVRISYDNYDYPKNIFPEFLFGEGLEHVPLLPHVSYAYGRACCYWRL